MAKARSSFVSSLKPSKPFQDSFLLSLDFHYNIKSSPHSLPLVCKPHLPRWTVQRSRWWITPLFRVLTWKHRAPVLFSTWWLIGWMTGFLSSRMMTSERSHSLFLTMLLFIWASIPRKVNSPLMKPLNPKSKVKKQLVNGCQQNISFGESHSGIAQGRGGAKARSEGQPLRTPSHQTTSSAQCAM